MWSAILQVTALATVTTFVSAQLTNFDSDYFNQNILRIKHQLELGSDIPQECKEQMDLYIAELELMSPSAKNWAWRMFDASGKINSGILGGSFVGTGNFHECMDIDEFVGNVDIKGQYCGFAINVPLINMSIAPPGLPDLMAYSVSICLPHKCKPSYFSASLTEIGFLNDSGCQTKDKSDELDVGDWFFIIFFAVIVLLAIMSTSYDIFCRTYNHETVPILLAFSFRTNGEKILHISENLPGQMGCLNGLRTLSMIWVLSGHRYSTMISLPHQNYISVFKWMDEVYSQYIQGATVSVDTFFFLAGLLSAYGIMKSQSKSNAIFNIPMFYIHRYLRLTPALAVLYFFYVTIMKHMGSGILWPMAMEMEIPICKEYWYSFFLYIQNYVNPTHMCLGHTWYLSVDMQFFIISPILLIPLVKYPQKTILALVVLIPLSVLPPILIIYFEEVFPKDSSKYMEYYYAQPWTRISPWLIGVLLGAILHRIRDMKIKINQFFNLGIWALVLAGMAAIIYAGHGPMASDNIVEVAMFCGLHRAAWALGLMWIVFACQTGYGGFVNSFLSWPFFQVMARLSYSMYLIHVIVLFFTIFTKTTEQYFDDLSYINLALGDIVMVAVVSLFFCLLFESPMVVLEKIAFRNRKIPVKLKPDDMTTDKKSNQNDIGDFVNQNALSNV